ncbi:MAG TPA: prepilin-type N-terminal cleavage/methylation domain-containing protein [bacterium]|nr:prepilin-type N-terminal cleavage/methylation domain-containing protein [bacterium]
MNSTSRNAHGFTLIELLVVISVLGLILAFFVPTIAGRITQNARRVATLQGLRVLRDAIAGNPDVQMSGEMVTSGFKNDVGRYPYDLIELATSRPDTGIYTSIVYVGKGILPAWDPYIKKGWNGPYVREDGRMGYRYDSWGDTLRLYIVGGETLGIESRGPDQLWNGTPGAKDTDDIIVMF